MYLMKTRNGSGPKKRARTSAFGFPHSDFFRISAFGIRNLTLAGILASTLCSPARDLVKDNIDWGSFLERHDLVWKKLPTAWSDAAFLGNGRLAVSMYG